MLHRRFAAWLVTGVWTLIGVLCLSIPFTAAYPWLFASTQIVEGYQVDSTLLLGAPQIVMPLAMLPLLAVQLYGLINLRRTFAAAARADWFAAQAVTGFRRFACDLPPSEWPKICIRFGHFETSLRLEPWSPDRWAVLFGLGVALVLAGKYEIALAPLLESEQLLPGTSGAILGLVAAYVHLGRIEDAQSARKRLAFTFDNEAFKYYRDPAHQAFLRDAWRKAA